MLRILELLTCKNHFVSVKWIDSYLLSFHSFIHSNHTSIYNTDRYSGCLLSVLHRFSFHHTFLMIYPWLMITLSPIYSSLYEIQTLKTECLLMKNKTSYWLISKGNWVLLQPYNCSWDQKYNRHSYESVYQFSDILSGL